MTVGLASPTPPEDAVQVTLGTAVLGYTVLPKRKRRGPPSIASLRLRDLGALFRDRYRGDVLPDDDAGRDDLYIALHHLAQVPRADAGTLASYIALHAPWMEAAEIEILVSTVLAAPRRWRADTLAWRLRMTAADRRRLAITTIGAIDLSRSAREALRRQLDRERKKVHRLRAGATPHEKSASGLKPWLALRMSRRTWERHGKPTGQAPAASSSAASSAPMVPTNLRQPCRPAGGRCCGLGWGASKRSARTGDPTIHGDRLRRRAQPVKVERSEPREAGLP